MHDASKPSPPRDHATSRLRMVKWKNRIDPTTYLGLHVTIGLAVAAFSIWLLGALLDAVLDNDVLVRWDMAADAAIHTHMTPHDLRVVDIITQLGSPIAMTLLGVAGAVLLWRAGHRMLLVGWAAAFVGGAILDQALKMAVHRSRPVYGAAYLQGNSFSFPSGHAMGSIIGYGMLLYMLRRVWPAGGWRRRVVDVAAALCILAIGFSRVLLGVHYPSDVLGGWAAGAAWMAVCIVGISISLHRQADRSHPVTASVIDTADPSRTHVLAP